MRFIALVVLLMGCNGCVIKPGPKIDEPVPDAGTCSGACFNGKQLSCPTFANTGQDGVMGNADDELCETVCKDFVDQGVPVNLRCLELAPNCGIYEACE
jgi:hypothetical protein